MPAQDLYHDLVKNVLRKDGWRITHNPFRLRKPRRVRQPIPDRALEVAETSLLGAEQDERKIAVAVKSFVGLEPDVLEQTLEALSYSRALLYALDHDRVLYLAIRRATYETLYNGMVEPQILNKLEVPLLVFEPRSESIVAWLPRHDYVSHTELA
ncbi:MAG: element excision factor XisH family protein [Candidatus Tectimicrobiota bacterium]